MTHGYTNLAASKNINLFIYKIYNSLFNSKILWILNMQIYFLTICFKKSCYQALYSGNCTTAHGAVSAMVYTEMNCVDYNTICMRKGWCKPTNSNWMPSCSPF